MHKEIITLEPLDGLLLKGQIDFFEHQSALEFKRLYYIVNGAPHLKSSFPSIDTNKTIQITDKKAQEYWKRYQFIMNQLGSYKKLVLDTCVFNVIPKKNSEIKAALTKLDESIMATNYDSQVAFR